MSTQDTTLPLPEQEREAFISWLCRTHPIAFAKNDAECLWRFGHVAALAWQARAAIAAQAQQPTAVKDSLTLEQVEAIADVDDAAYCLLAILQRVGPGATVGQVLAILEQAQQAQECDEQAPASIRQAYAMAQVLLDVHAELGCKWGDNIYKAISDLKQAQQAQGVPVLQRALSALEYADLRCGQIGAYERQSAIEGLRSLLAAAPQAEPDICGTCDGRGCPVCRPVPEPQPEREPLSQFGNMVGTHDMRPMNSEVTHGVPSLVLGIGTKGGDK